MPEAPSGRRAGAFIQASLGDAHTPGHGRVTRMSIPGLKLAAVRRKSGGRIHLVPRVPRSGPVSTLCGQTLDAGSFAAVDIAADCVNCIRRSRDASKISSAFFESEEGSELLRISLEQARLRRPA